MSREKNIYHHREHNKHLLQVHLIFVCKYRKRLLLGEVSEDMKQIIFDISKHYGWDVKLQETDKDHIHILFCLFNRHSFGKNH